MASATAKPVAIAALFLAVWFGAYWLYEPTSKHTRITFGLPPSPAAAAVATEPVPALAPASAPPLAHGAASVAAAAGAAASNKPQAEVAAKAVVHNSDAGPAASRDTVIPPEFTTYTVQKGDGSFEAIARRLGGGAKLAEAIKRSNAFVSPNKLIPGRTQLRIPVDPDNIDGKVVRAEANGAGGDGGSPRAATAQGQSHTVVAGETLSSIATKYYKSSASWKLIFDANRDKLDKPERVKVGMVLHIPQAG